MQAYKTLLQDVYDNGRTRADRTGTGTRSVFGRQIEFDLTAGFPLLTLKSTPLRAVAAELVWFLEGSTTTRRLNELGSTIWDRWAVAAPTTRQVELTVEERCELLVNHLGISKLITSATVDGNWALENPELFDQYNIPSTKTVTLNQTGDLGPIYGVQWRGWVGVSNEQLEITDQIQAVIQSLRTNPWSRRHLVSAWNVADLPDELNTPQENVLNGKQALAPCHVMFQFYVEEMTPLERIAHFNRDPDNVGIRMGVNADTVTADQMDLLDRLLVPTMSLSCQVYMRSVDVPVGLPFNIASYALLTQLMANECGMSLGRLVMSLGDAHIYHDQTPMVEDMLTRTPNPSPRLHLHTSTNVTHHTVADIVAGLSGYDPHPHLRIPVSV